MALYNPVTKIVQCLALVLVSAGGVSCSYILAGTSMGGAVEVRGPADDATSNFRIHYENWIGFNHDLTVSVDSAFARLKANDKDAWAALRDFVTPAKETLARYGVTYVDEPYTPSFPRPVPDYSAKKFVLSSYEQYSRWSSLERRPGFAPNGFAVVPVIDGHYRIRAKIVRAEAEFNSLQTRRVFIKADLIVQMQLKSADGWTNVGLDHNNAELVSNQLRKDLNRAYYRYLSNRYALEFTAPDFRGLNEQ
jgi:hypothetical protein